MYGVNLNNMKLKPKIPNSVGDKLPSTEHKSKGCLARNNIQLKISVAQLGAINIQRPLTTCL